MNIAFNRKWFYGLLASFIASCLGLLWLENYYILLLPVVLILLYTMIVKPVYVIYFLAFATPLSVQWSTETDSLAMSVPTEPLIILLFMGLLLKMLHARRIPLEVFKSALAILISVDIAWLAITTFSSSMPLISFKYLLSKIWYVVVFYFLLTHLFKNEKVIKGLS